MKAARRETTSHRRPEERQAQLLGCKRCGVLLEPGLVEGAPTCGRCGWPGKDRRSEVQRTQDANAANMQEMEAERLRLEKLNEQLRGAVDRARKADARIKALEGDLAGANDFAEGLNENNRRLEKRVIEADARIAEQKQLIEDLMAQLDELAGLGRDRGTTPDDGVAPGADRDRKHRSEIGENAGRAEESPSARGTGAAAPARAAVPLAPPSRATTLSTGPRVVLTCKVAPWCVEWLRRESSGSRGWAASGTRGGASGYAARILESAAAAAAEMSAITHAGNTELESETESK